MKIKNRFLFICVLTLIILAAGLLLAFLAAKGLKIPCPLYNITGIMCPGCGNTRATLALLQLDIKAMLKFNLMYPVQIIYIARIYYICSKNYIKNSAFKYHIRPDWVDIVCLSSILVWMIVRNILVI